jgi:excisionase family DNA binding protein
MLNNDFPTSDRSPREGATGTGATNVALMTVPEVADAMRVSNMTVYRLIKSGDLGAVRVGHHYRIRAGEVERYLLERSVHVEGA